MSLELMNTIYLGSARPSSGGGTTGNFLKQLAVMPTAGADYENEIVEYVGATDAYTNAYIYKCVKTTTYTATVAFNPEKISVSGADFITSLQAKGPSTFMNVVSGTMTYYTAADLWVFDGKNADGEVVLHYQQYTDNWENEGWTFTGEFEDEEVVNFTSEIIGTDTYNWVRTDVQPASGTDPHNLGWYSNPTALRTAHPTATNGDYAIVGSTDTVWVWDSDSTDWKDSGSGGAVTSVNSKTGVVVLTGADINATVGASTDTIDNQLSALNTALSGKQATLTAGNNITITDNTISATDTTYTAGTGIDITNGVISNTQTSAAWGNITGTLSSQTDLQNALDAKQATLTAGTGITITNNTIASSVTQTTITFKEW